MSTPPPSLPGITIVCFHSQEHKFSHKWAHWIHLELQCNVAFLFGGVRWCAYRSWGEILLTPLPQEKSALWYNRYKTKLFILCLLLYLDLCNGVFYFCWHFCPWSFAFSSQGSQWSYSNTLMSSPWATRHVNLVWRSTCRRLRSGSAFLPLSLYTSRYTLQKGHEARRVVHIS